MAFEELLLQNPKLSIVVVAFLITFIMTLITKNFTDQKRMKELKEKQKEMQKKLKEAQGDTSKMSEINKEMMGKIRDAVSELPKRQRMCFVLFEIEGHSINEIADIMGSSAGAVKFNIHQARKKLREQLSDLKKETDIPQ